MTFVPLHNFKQIQRRSLGSAIALKFIDINTTERTLYSGQDASGLHNPLLFPISSSTSYEQAFIKPHASSDSSFQEGTYTVPNEVGTTTLLSMSGTEAGNQFVFSVTSTQEATINSIVFTRQLYYSSSNKVNAVIFAVLLDSPVTLNAGNNFTASFTFSVAFN